jgi:hypothetical protein
VLQRGAFYRSRDGRKALQLVGRTSDRIGSTAQQQSVKLFFFFFFFFRADNQLLNVNKPTTTTTSLSSVYISLSLFLSGTHKFFIVSRIIFLRKMKRLVSSASPRLSESGGQEFAETKKPGNWKARTTVRE